MKVELVLLLELPQARESLTPIEVGTAVQHTLRDAEFQLKNHLRAIGAMWDLAHVPNAYTVRVVSAQERTK